MMEETNDEQPEIVTHEEVALAEREAAQSSAGNTKYTLCLALQPVLGVCCLSINCIFDQVTSS